MFLYIFPLNKNFLNSSKQKSSAEVSQRAMTADLTSDVKGDVKKEDIQTKPELGMSSAIDPSELVNHIDKAIPDSAIAESVDSLSSDKAGEKSLGQIVVRAKIMLGDLLFTQGEFDLASQVYEEVVKKYAFSGYVLKALGRLVSCSEKLKQPDKQAKYYSLLHDFFEAT